MIGVFDSGVGGLVSARELAGLLPGEDIVFFADRKNAPYGTKEKDELIRLVKADIKRLSDMGAEKILIACCTASAVYPYLDPLEREISLPIIRPAVSAALAVSDRLAVISTLYTRRSHAFEREARRRSPTASVTEIAVQELVRMVECGARDGALSRECGELLDRLCGELIPPNTGALILGCTHFSHLEGELGKRLPGVKIISPAKEGARELAGLIKSKNQMDKNGRRSFISAVGNK